MKLDLKPGKYVVAVSGGVDSVVLLYLLAKSPESRALSSQLVIAHFDHGMREESGVDALFVRELAHKYGVEFEGAQGKLGAGASEAEAREARYGFLRRVMSEQGADGIITAHHQDDLIETAILNLLRGTGRKGLSSLQNGGGIVRPLLHVPKAELVKHAQDHGLAWREDSTNQDIKYRRNYVRHKLLPSFTETDKQKLLSIIYKTQILNSEIDKEIANYVRGSTFHMERHWFIMLPHAVSLEVMAAWLRKYEIRQFDKKTLQRLVTAAKTYRPGQKADINAGTSLHITKAHLKIVN